MTDAYAINVAGQSRGRRFRHFGEFLDTITYAIQRLDHINAICASFEFLAQPFDVAIDSPVINIYLLVVSQHPSRHRGFSQLQADWPTPAE